MKMIKKNVQIVQQRLIFNNNIERCGEVVITPSKADEILNLITISFHKKNYWLLRRKILNKLNSRTRKLATVSIS